MLELKSFDDVKIDNKIELPTMAELLFFPFCNVAHLDDLYKIANSDLRNMISKIPLQNNRKYVTVNMTTQILSPNVTAAPRGNWHFDSDTLRDDSNTNIHLLLSECTALTEFAKNKIVLNDFNENSKVLDVEIFMNQNLNLIDETVTMPSNRFVTFNGAKNIHRAINAQRIEFRFTMRVMESNIVRPTSNFIQDKSHVFNDGIEDYSKITKDFIRNNESQCLDSIVKYKDRIHLFIN